MTRLNFTQIIPVLIQNRDGIIIQEEVKAVTSLNHKGIFDVLPLHENFISLIKGYIILHRKNGETNELKITEGVLEVEDNKITIFLEIFSKTF